MAEPSKPSEPASPSARLMQSPSFNLCILGVYGFATPLDVNVFRHDLPNTFLKHPRFSSILVRDKNGRNLRWKPTTVDLDNHLFCPDLDPDMESPDQFVEDYVSGMSRAPMDLSKPLWEIHILNVKTSDANSVAIFKIHHSIGDGVSMVSLLLAFATKTSDPESLPTLPVKKPKTVHNVGMVKRLLVLLWTLVLVVFYTLIDSALLLATLMFYKDTHTPIKPRRGSKIGNMRFVHRILDFNDVKLVKNAMNVSINDVVMGVTEAGISHYLNTRYEIHRRNSTGPKVPNKETTFLPKNILLRSAVVFNLRPSPSIKDLSNMIEKEKELKGVWGNMLGIVVLAHTIDIRDDPLSYVRRAKATMDRKKLSLEPKCVYLIMKLLIFLFGAKTAAAASRVIFRRTTLTFSNVVGPVEEISIFGHPVVYIAPSVCGFPQGLVIHYQSYGDKLTISMGADDKLIPNPHQLCDDLVKSLHNIKDAVIKTGLLKNHPLC